LNSPLNGCEPNDALVAKQLMHALRPCLQVTIPPTAVFYRRQNIFSKSDKTNAI
jgi:hypothetical protein